MSGGDPHRRRGPSRPAGSLLAVVAELSSAGLLGLSGWFISACAVAGAATFSSFSYIAPSGGVRAFALARIAGNYSKRLVLHAAALRRVAAARADLFDRAAAADRAELDGMWSGELLDRSMADADSVGMALIRSTAPVAVTAAMTAGAVLAVALATSIAPAAVLAAGVAIIALIAHRTPRAAREAEQHTRKALRAELVTAIDAWTEMASLGAAGQLAARTTARFAQLDTAREAVSRHRLRTALITGLVGTATLTATTDYGDRHRPDPATFVFVALMTSACWPSRALATAAEARATAMAAHAPPHGKCAVTRAPWPSRGCGPGPPSRASASPTTGSRRWPSGRGASSAPASPAAAMLVVTGRSGSGKSTLLRALASSLRKSLAPRTGPPSRPSPPTTTSSPAHSDPTGASPTPTMTDKDIDERLAELRLERTD